MEHIEKHCSTAAPTREAALELAQRMLVAGFFVSAVWNERTVKLKSGGEKVRACGGTRATTMKGTHTTLLMC